MKNLIVGPLSPFQATALSKELEDRDIPFDILKKDINEIHAEKDLFGRDVPSDALFMKIDRNDVRENRSLFKDYEIHLAIRAPHPMELENYEPAPERKEPPKRSKIQEILWRVFLATLLVILTISLYRNPTLEGALGAFVFAGLFISAYLRRSSPF